MAKSNYAKDFFKANPVITIAGVTIVGFIAFRIIRKAINKGKIPILPPIPPVPVNPTEPEQKRYTYLAQQYADFADAIQAACDGPGTNEDDIAAVMKRMVTKADVLALIDAWGKRTITTPYGWDSEPMTLSQTFRYELSPDAIDTYVNQPLKRTGYKF